MLKKNLCFFFVSRKDKKCYYQSLQTAGTEFRFWSWKASNSLLCFIMHNWNSSQLQKCKLLLIASICTWNREAWRPLIVKELCSYILICFEGIKVNRECALLWKPCRHLISTFLWIIRWIHLPWKSPSSEISWQSEIVPSQHVWAPKEPCLDCSLMV